MPLRGFPWTARSAAIPCRLQRAGQSCPAVYLGWTSCNLEGNPEGQADGCHEPNHNPKFITPTQPAQCQGTPAGPFRPGIKQHGGVATRPSTTVPGKCRGALVSVRQCVLRRLNGPRDNRSHGPETGGSWTACATAECARPYRLAPSATGQPSSMTRLTMPSKSSATSSADETAVMEDWICPSPCASRFRAVTVDASASMRALPSSLCTVS